MSKLHPTTAGTIPNSVASSSLDAYIPRSSERRGPSERRGSTQCGCSWTIGGDDEVGCRIAAPRSSNDDRAGE